MNVAVIDTKLVMYQQQHRHKHAFQAILDVAQLGVGLLPHCSKIIWAKDLGKSKRCTDFPAYKAHRKERNKKMSATEKRSLEKFLDIYESSNDVLSILGNVISMEGIEADDLAYIIADRFAKSGDVNVYLISSDADWARFLVADNIKMLHYGRAILIGAEDAEREFKVPQQWGLFVDSVAGVVKENVDGITKAGKGRVLQYLKKAEYNKEEFFKIFDEAVEAHKYGFKFPEWASSTKEVSERNLKILAPITWEDLSSKEKEDFRAQWSSVCSKSEDELIQVTTMKYNYTLIPNPDVKRFYGI